eukprot:230633_1
MMFFIPFGWASGLGRLIIIHFVSAKNIFQMRRSKGSTLLISDQACTICIVASLCLWLCCALIFVLHTSNTSPPSSPKPQWTSFVQSNNVASPQAQAHSSSPVNPSLSYLESLSPELSSSGWKPIHIRTLNIRQPIEQMDYLLEKYWYPNTNKKHTTAGANKQNIHNTTITVSTTTSDVQYPSDWSMRCFPSQVNSAQCISHHMQYWRQGISILQSKPMISDKYVTFLKDCGGWNNIRQGFEFHVMVAWITNRTLVLPPDTPWYLIDRGGLTRGRDGMHATDQVSWPDNAPRLEGVSNYDIWFDLDDMSMAIPVITAAQFIKREYDHLSMPQQFYGGDIVNKDKNIGQQFTQWMTKKATELNVLLPWGQLGNVLYWPSIEEVQQQNSAVINAQWVDSRTAREYTAFLKEQPFIHFPSCQKGLPGASQYGNNYRYLGQIARSIAFNSVEMDKKYKQILRDHVHLKAQIMEYAAAVVSILGGFKYASLHIRRNELQYKYVWCTAEESYRNIKPLIGEKEVLYIATDEVESGFFDVFAENGRRKVYQWSDFFGPQAQFEQTKNIVIPGKLHGEVEMAICAMGRVFFGTKESTFSSYIGRLRGYMHAPYTQVLYHHYQLTRDIEESSAISRSNPGKPYAGQIYKIPFQDLWTDIEALP